jgi:hypothetical protein
VSRYIEEHRGRFGVEPICSTLDVSASTRERVQEVRLIHHSDRGSQYMAGDYTQTLADHDVLASVGSTGDAYDNSMAESFVEYTLAMSRTRQLGWALPTDLRSAASSALIAAESTAKWLGRALLTPAPACDAEGKGPSTPRPKPTDSRRGCFLGCCTSWSRSASTVAVRP